MGLSQQLKVALDQLKVALDQITTARARLVNATKSPWWARPKFLTHIVGPVTAVAVVIAVFNKTHELTLFTLHPICMCIAVLVLMPEGVVSYRNHLLLDSFGPIMQHGTKHKNRTIHMALQVLAAFFTALGLAFAFIHKLAIGKSVLPASPHSFFGALVTACIALQVVVGRLKHIGLTARLVDARNRGKRFRWHGKMGLLSYDLSTVTLMLGVLAYLGLSWLTISVILLVAYAWLNVNLQMHESKHVSVPIFHDGGEMQLSEVAPEAQQLTEEGIPEAKGEREYPL